MAKVIDACGQACPGPVLMVKETLESEQPDNLLVRVDNSGSAENVTRFLTVNGYAVEERHEDGVYTLAALLDGKTASPAEEQKTVAAGDTAKKMLVLVTSETLGTGDDELGRKLMVAYLKTIKEMGPELWQLIFVNGGVKLTTASSPVLEELREYEAAGTIVLACGTCLEHFGLTEQKQVGGTTNMLDIVTATQLADNVVSVG